MTSSDQLFYWPGLQGRVANKPNIASYLASERRIPFNEDGIFRHYPELEEEQNERK